MTLVRLWQGKEGGAGTIPLAEDGSTQASVIKNRNVLELLATAIHCNSVGELLDTGEIEAGATDKAMMQVMLSWGFDIAAQRKKFPQVDRFQFDSTRKRIATILEDSACSYGKRLYTKGASETIIETCTHYLDQEGNEQAITDNMRSSLASIVNEYAEEALRTIGLAYRDLSAGMGGELHNNKSESKPYLHEIEEVADGTKGFTLIGIAGIMDIIRDTVPDAVKTCRGAGVRVRMVTGDNLVTAKAIAKMCGIIDEKEANQEHICMTGPNFNEFVGGMVNKKTKEPIKVLGKDAAIEEIGNKKNMEIVRTKLKVLARSSP